ncbi:YchJ family protein [Marinimicrobium sp. ABcell2]|uniref:YchJ family protein n=1 Tax=Marinimicrobium sp. ABcell2 TaxID=3069751 RepID=UPI0027B09E14|nr:YchJ family protein [Marinimicrobium sp. ABcell2]MDQ2077790.1 YchJ family protein [Marinimicrobium sp. ABcell2]
MKDSQICPCGSQKTYERCCGRYHAGEPAPTPEALMRSRFSAFVQNRADYLTATWHSSTRPKALDLTDSPDWVGLSILASDAIGDQGHVHFRAYYRAGNQWRFLEERSTFVRESERWFYVSGETQDESIKPARNDSCLCGSGRKFKRCCG